MSKKRGGRVMNDQRSIGKALEPLETGTGLIEVFVMLQEGEER